MSSPRLLSITAIAALLSLASSDPNSICYSYGVDFVDEGHYFINSESNENFTCVSTFQGCNEGEDKADVLLAGPNGEYLCSQVTTTPENDPKLSTCPILKSQMVSGDWIIMVIGNNDDGQPYAWERDISLDVGPQSTTTVTPTVTFDVTTTPIVTSTVTSTFVATSSVGPLTTLTVPSATAKKTKTVTPKAVTTTSTKTFTRVQYTWKNQLSVITKTVTASCTTPSLPGRKDKPATYSPTLIHPAALVTPTGAASPKFHRYARRADRAVDIEYARKRFEAAKLKRDQNAGEAIAAPLDARAPDAPTITVTAQTPVNATVTHSAAPITSTESTLVSSTTTTTLPPATVYSGVFTSTTTAPTPTKTQVAFGYTTSTSTITIGATWTRTVTVSPTASASACRKVGGTF